MSRTQGDWKKAEKLIAIEMRLGKKVTRQQAIERLSRRYEPNTIHNDDLLVI
jgi:hypothetical protein